MSVIKRMEKEAGLVYRLQLHIKPGAKRSQVTDVGTDSVGLQVTDSHYKWSIIFVRSRHRQGMGRPMRRCVGLWQNALGSVHGKLS
jgi:hypothetical protein